MIDPLLTLISLAIGVLQPLMWTSPADFSGVVLEMCMRSIRIEHGPARIKRLLDWCGELPADFYSVSISTGKHKLFKWFLTACVSIAVSSTFIEKGLNPVLLIFLPVIAAGLLRGDYAREFILSQKKALLLFFLYVALLFTAVMCFRSYFTLPVVMLYFSFGILMIRVLSPLTDRNIGQVILLSLGLVLINCIITNHLVFGILLPVYVFALMGALLLLRLAITPSSEGYLESDGEKIFRKSLVRKLFKSAIFVSAISVLFFILIPRPFISMPGFRFGASASELGAMSQRISYRDMIGGDMQRIAFMVRMESGSIPKFPYWRGRTLEKYDGRGWVYSGESKSPAKPVPIDYSKAIMYQFMPYKLQTNTIYAYGYPVGALGKNNQQLYISPGGEVIVDSPFLFSDSYRIIALDRPFPTGRRSLETNLDKAGASAEIESLARGWTEGLTAPEAKANRIVSRLMDRCKYVLQPEIVPEGINPLEHFLFTGREGNCEYFAGALCLMLRSQGIPARVVEGFSGMQPSNVPDEYIVRFGHAHAWVEAVLDGANWTTLDATPPSRMDFAGNYLTRLMTDAYDTIEKKWTKYVVYFDRSDQFRLFRELRELLELDLPPFAIRSRIYLIVLLVTGAIIACIFIVKNFRDGRRRSAESIYKSVMNSLVRIGALDSVHQWHEANTEKILDRIPQSTDSVRDFMNIYFEHRFGANGASMGRLQDAGQEMIQEIKKELIGSRQ